MPKPATPHFAPVYAALHAILKKHERMLRVLKDGPGGYELAAGYSEKYGRDVWFGGVRPGKRYVSFYLMPIYMHPELLKSTTPQLRKRMQGKSCFNFKTVEPELLRELAVLTKSCVERFKKEGLL
jgi:hypothetical protein